ncbi:hypothetical protein CTI14_69610, partial [Methylobacterium radiotolerans]
ERLDLNRPAGLLPDDDGPATDASALTRSPILGLTRSQPSQLAVERLDLNRPAGLLPDDDGPATDASALTRSPILG